MRCQHGNLLWPPDRAFPAGDTPYCHLCWRKASPPAVASPDPIPPRRERIDSSGLPAVPHTGRAFNPGLVRHAGRWLLAHRTGWAGSRIAVCEVDPAAGWKPGTATVLPLRHPAVGRGAEDPRLFVWRDRLHVSFTAYDGALTHQMYARLTADGFGVEEEFCPTLPFPRQKWEKNWVFFEGRDTHLYCVYQIDPVHKVLRVDGDLAEVAGQTASPVVGWAGGHLRGGASPVFVGGEYWHWFHGMKEAGEPNRRYSVGVYTFDPEPPFAVRRWSPDPVAWASEHDWLESGNYCRVAFPGGAVLDEYGRWQVSVGVHDRWCEVWSWDHAAVRRHLGMEGRRGLCLHLGQRTEFRAGCNGNLCKHNCEAGEPVAVPGGVCQTCERWEPA